MKYFKALTSVVLAEIKGPFIRISLKISNNQSRRDKTLIGKCILRRRNLDSTHAQFSWNIRRSLVNFVFAGCVSTLRIDCGF